MPSWICFLWHVLYAVLLKMFTNFITFLSFRSHTFCEKSTDVERLLLIHIHIFMETFPFLSTIFLLVLSFWNIISKYIILKFPRGCFLVVTLSNFQFHQLGFSQFDSQMQNIYKSNNLSGIWISSTKNNLFVLYRIFKENSMEIECSKMLFS